MLAGLEFDRERIAAAADDEMLAATDVADLLVRKGMPFREAHGVVGGLVRGATESGRRLSEIGPEELREHSELLDDAYYEVLARAAVDRIEALGGGTASAAVGRAARARPARRSPIVRSAE